MIAKWQENLKARMQDPQTVVDYVGALMSYRTDVRRAAIDLDSADNKRLADIATGWKHIAPGGQPIAWVTANGRLSALRDFFRYSVSQGWLPINPLP